MSLFDKILTSKELTDKPPVLIDIGASGKLNKQWKKISKYLIYIAFDADEREFSFVKEETNKYKKLLIYNCIVTATDFEEADFYLTRSPFCSSLLQPDTESLRDWAFSDLFEIEKKVNMKTKSLMSILAEAKIDYMDWFKTDSQGIDLRLFASIPEDIRNHILVAEFEPGIIDAYHGEDKLFRLFEFMDNKNFFVSNLKIKGTQRISADLLGSIAKFEKLKKLIQFSMKTSPGWAEVTYMNSFKGKYSRREYLLGWIFATIKKQYGFSITLADEGHSIFKDKIFHEMKNHSLKQIYCELLKLKLVPTLFRRIKELIT